VPDLAELKPKVPVMFHWGELDQAIPLPSVKEFIAKHPELAATSFIYPGAGHGFNCEERGSYNAEAAKLARQRTLEFLRKHVG
jgi:carboxymethylenebutenolidase